MEYRPPGATAPLPLVLVYHGPLFGDRHLLTVAIAIYFHYGVWVFPKMVVPPKHPKMVMFSRKTNSCWVPPF